MGSRSSFGIRFSDEASELRAWNTEDTETLRNAFCLADESPGDAVLGDAYIAQVKSVADGLVSRVSSRWSAMEAEAREIEEVAVKLVSSKDETVSAKASQIRDTTRTLSKSLKNITEGRLRGSNNPKIRARIEYGKAQHDATQNSLCRDSNEIRLPSGRQMDCVIASPSACEVVEIKPDNTRARGKGGKQVDDYLSEIRSMFSKVVDKTDKERAALFEGRMSIFLRCMRPDSINISGDVVVYPYCPSAEDVSESP